MLENKAVKESHTWIFRKSKILERELQQTFTKHYIMIFCDFIWILLMSLCNISDSQKPWLPIENENQITPTLKTQKINTFMNNRKLLTTKKHLKTEILFSCRCSHLFNTRRGSRPLVMVTEGLGPPETWEPPFHCERFKRLPPAPKELSCDAGDGKNTGELFAVDPAGVPEFWILGVLPWASDLTCVLFIWLILASTSGLGSLKLGTSEKIIQNSPIFWRSPVLPLYSVRQPLKRDAYPRFSRMISPVWMKLPTSSHTDMVTLPVLSATLHERISCPSFVLDTRPVSRTMKTKLIFFNPGFRSLIRYVFSLDPFAILKKTTK